VFAFLSPGNMMINMIGSGMSGTVASNGEMLMQDYKAGKIVGSQNRHLTILQLMAVPVGSIAVALVYPALKARYGIGGQGLTSPISVKWAGFAELLNQGFSQLPRGCFDAMLVAVALGIVITAWSRATAGSCLRRPQSASGCSYRARRYSRWSRAASANGRGPSPVRRPRRSTVYLFLADSSREKRWWYWSSPSRRCCKTPRNPKPDASVLRTL
jgi:hypothetical protein